MRRGTSRVLLCLLALGVVVAGAALVWRDLPGGGAGDTDRTPSREGRWARAADEPRYVRALAGEVVDELGVVSFNIRRTSSAEQQADDWRRITDDPRVDLIGWQESKSQAFRDLYPRWAERGWGTWHQPDPDRAISLAFSWRTSEFALLAVRERRMHDGAFPSQTDRPYPARWVVEAQLRHRPTGRVVTLLNTHVTQGIETGQRFERNINARDARTHFRRLTRLWDAVPGDVVVGTGDYNFDHYDDSRARPAGGISRTVAREALSSYDALGLRGVVPSRNTRWIDYVWLARSSVRGPGGEPGGTAQFATHRTLSGYHSDHRPVLARIRLYEP